VNKAELVDAVAEQSGYEKQDIEGVLTAAIDAVTEALAGGDIVRLGPLGSFLTREEGMHMTHVPGKEGLVEVPAQTRVLFHPAKALKTAVNGGQEPAEPTEPAEPEAEEEGAA
jgi:DNA-binding protein HU-beta